MLQMDPPVTAALELGDAAQAHGSWQQRGEQIPGFLQQCESLLLKLAVASKVLRFEH